MAKITDITGVILAGGKSSRFGTNKAFASFQGICLIEKVLEVLQSVFERCLVVTNTPKEFQHLPVEVVKDVIPHRGPLGGILTGLLNARNPKIFVSACDTPLLHEDVIRFLVHKGQGFDAVIPVHNEIREYLMGLYSRNLKTLILQHLSEENLSMKAFSEKIPHLIWIQLEGDYAFNVNTREDLKTLEKNHAH